jgi:hypothetical protein
MARNVLFVLALASVVGFGALGCKGDRNKCEEACRNYATLTYWEKTDIEIAATPEAERENLKKKRLAEFTNYLEQGVDLCTNQCASANNDEQIDCMRNAKTGPEVRKCSSKDD